MKPAEASNKEPISFAIQEQNSGIVLDSVINRAKSNVFSHIKQSTDVVLVTSINRKTISTFVDEVNKEINNEIRSLSLRSEDLLKAVEQGDSSSERDLGLISSIIYESIQLDEHLLISINDVDQLPIDILNKLVSLALNTNSKKNNIIFMFTGGPDLLSQIEQISNIRRLSIAHCTLDDLMLEDLVEFIDTRQKHLGSNEQFKFDEQAIKTIVTHASGSLEKAAILLEWCREYCNFKDTRQVTASLVSELLSILLNKSQAEGENLFGIYPTVNYNFNALPDLGGEDSANQGHHVDMGKADSIEAEENPSIQIVGEKPRQYVPNVFERAMTDASEAELISEGREVASESGESTQKLEFQNIGEEDIEHIVVEAKNSKPFDEEIDGDSIESIAKFSAIDDSIEYINKADEESKPIHIENTDLSLTSLVPKNLGTSHSLSSLQWTFIILIVGAILFYGGIMFLASQGSSVAPDSFSYDDDGSIIEPVREIDEPDSLVSVQGFDIDEVPAESTIDEEEKPSFLGRIKSIALQFTRSDDKEEPPLPVSNYSPTLEPLELPDPSITGSTKENTIYSLLTLAQDQMQRKNLTTPPSDNALETYKMVLKLDPDNELALSGIEAIRVRYLIWAEQQVLAGNSSQAKVYLDRAVDISSEFTK